MHNKVLNICLNSLYTLLQLPVDFEHFLPVDFFAFYANKIALGLMLVKIDKKNRIF